MADEPPTCIQIDRRSVRHFENGGSAHDPFCMLAPQSVRARPSFTKSSIVAMHQVISKILRSDFTAMHQCVTSRQSQVALARGSAAESSTLIPRYHKILILCISSMVLFFVQGGRSLKPTNLNFTRTFFFIIILTGK